MYVSLVAACSSPVLTLYSHSRRLAYRSHHVLDHRCEHHEEEQDPLQVAQDCRDSGFRFGHLFGQDRHSYEEQNDGDRYLCSWRRVHTRRGP
jgi:hypothetical protein